MFQLVIKKGCVCVCGVGVDGGFFPYYLGYLCRPEANVHSIEFTRFKLRDLDTETVLFEVCKPPEEEMPEDLPPNATRFVRYQFPPEFLQLKTVGAT